METKCEGTWWIEEKHKKREAGKSEMWLERTEGEADCDGDILFHLLGIEAIIAEIDKTA